MEDLIPACDVVCSMFSNCNFDACYINWFSSEGGCVPLSLLYNKEVLDYYSAIVDVETFPVFQLDLVQKGAKSTRTGTFIEKGIKPLFSRAGCRKG